jgi:hypothetical protein
MSSFEVRFRIAFLHCKNVTLPNRKHVWLLNQNPMHLIGIFLVCQIHCSHHWSYAQIIFQLSLPERGEGGQWKRINHKQSARWQHLSRFLRLIYMSSFEVCFRITFSHCKKRKNQSCCLTRLQFISLVFFSFSNLL